MLLFRDWMEQRVTMGRGVLLDRMAARYDLENDLISYKIIYFLNILVLFK